MLFLQRFSCSSAAGAEVALQMARWQSTSLRPKRGGAARSGLHLPPRTQNPSFSLLTHQAKVMRTRPGLPLNRPFSDPWPPIRCTRSEARTLAPPGSGLRSNLSRLTGEKTFLYSKLADARVTQNAPTPGQLRMPTHRNPAHAVAIGCVWLQRRCRTKWINFTVKTQQKARQRKYVQYVSEVVWKKKNSKTQKESFPLFWCLKSSLKLIFKGHAGPGGFSPFTASPSTDYGYAISAAVFLVLDLV